MQADFLGIPLREMITPILYQTRGTRVARLLHEVRRFLQNRTGSGVVGVSGGADSVALLRALHVVGVPRAVAHVNHKLRGDESDADEAFVRELCGTLGVPCHVKTADMAARAPGANLEAAARQVRYSFFVEVAAEVRAEWVATAHTANDQAETVLHRLLRGTGLQGLRGILSGQGGMGSEQERGQTEKGERPGAGIVGGNVPSLSTSPTIHLLRPLLGVTRTDVLDYLAALNQSFREDASNADPRFTRNRIRHELLPLLETFNPAIVSALTHIAEHASEAHDALVSLAGELLAQSERPRAANAIVLDTATLAAAPRAIRRIALRLIWEREGWPVGEMSFDSWDRAVEITGGNASACDFPAGVSMRKAGRVVQIARRE